MKKFLAFLLFMPLVSAIPEIGHQFYGVVEGDIPVDAEILALIDGIEYVSAEIVDGRYGYSTVFFVPADDLDTAEKEGGVQGDTIYFYLSDEKIGEYDYLKRGTTRLDFEIFMDISEQRNNTSSNNRDDGINISIEKCIYRWDCTIWSRCLDGKQTRSCSNAGTCPDEYNRPAESLTCVLESCSDGIRNQDETDTDCGGLCEKCGNGKRCRSNADCSSGYCFDKMCSVKETIEPSKRADVEPEPVIEETCFDGLQNQDETDIDCGGSCEPCSSVLPVVVAVVGSVIVLAAIATGFAIYRKKSSLRR